MDCCRGLEDAFRCHHHFGLQACEEAAKRSPVGQVSDNRPASWCLSVPELAAAAAPNCLGFALLSCVNEAFKSQFTAVFITLLQQMKAVKPKGT